VPPHVKRTVARFNKRLALAALVAFVGINGLRLTVTNDEAYDFIIDIAPANSTTLGRSLRG
jgi:death on curing protein